MSLRAGRLSGQVHAHYHTQLMDGDLYETLVVWLYIISELFFINVMYVIASKSVDIE